MLHHVQVALKSYCYAYQHIVARGIVYSGTSIRLCAPSVVNTCLKKYWTYFYQTFSFDAFWGNGEKIKVQGHGVVERIRKCTFVLVGAMS